MSKYATASRVAPTDFQFPEPASSVRWHMMVMVTVTAILTYLDRLNLSIAGKFIQDEFAIPVQTMGWIFSAFLLGYALSQVPGGYLADRFGPRKVLVVAITWWSALTAATAVAPKLALTHWLSLAWSFAVIRFLIGVGEAPSSPSYTKVVGYWLGDARHGIGSSFTMLGIGIGGACTPVLITAIMQHWGWRAAFYICGAMGTIVAFAWYWYATDRPEEHASVNSEELRIIQSHRSSVARAEGPAKRAATPWRQMVTSRSVIGLVLGYFCQGFPIYFFHTWLFIYLVKVRGFSVSHGGIFGALPYVAIAVLAPIGGAFSDRAVQKFGRRMGRKVAVWVGMTCSAVLMWSGAHAGNRITAILLLAAAAGFNMFAAASFWAACIDLTRKHCGAISGLMNTFGNLGGWLSPIVTAYIATRFGWAAALNVAAVVTLASAICWVFVDTSKPIESPA